jgi:hypothetical protein
MTTRRPHNDGREAYDVKTKVENTNNTYKDVVGFFILFFGLLLLVCFWPDLLGNVNN